MRNELPGETKGAKTTAAAAYGEIDDENLVMVIAAAGDKHNHASEVDDTLKEIGSGSPVTVNAGPLGQHTRSAWT